VSLDQRLSRLAPALTAQERAILILEAWKEGRTEDPVWRNSMPREQSNAFNRYIELMNQANVLLGRVISVLHMQVEALQTREAWLVDITLWLEHIEEIRRAVRRAVKEPITESDHQAAVEASRNEWVPVEELAAFLAGYHEYADDDYDSDEEWPVVKDHVWDQAVAEEEQRLRGMVAEGTLQGRGKGKALKLQQGALSHFGHKVGAASEDYVSYRVVPDDQAEAVEEERRLLKGLQRTLDWQPFDGPDRDALTGMPEKIRQAVRESTAYRLISIWVQLRTAEVLVSEIGEEFNGIDPLRPVFREKLDGAKESLREIQSHLAYLSMEVELREPLEEELREMRDCLAETPATS
jgi:hypothetical protein